MTQYFYFFFNDPATTEIYTTVHTLSLRDALPISSGSQSVRGTAPMKLNSAATRSFCTRSEEHTSELQSRTVNSYAVFCLKKKKRPRTLPPPPPKIRSHRKISNNKLC